ncbi:MAG: dTDP-4-dehydrorhamnose reductase [Solirubrobacteraceae bacterium]
MRILITGAAGMLGTDVRAAADAAGHEPVALGRADLDIADAIAVRRAVSDVAPDVVVNCAAWTNVDGAEADFAAALAINGPGAGNVAAAATDAGAWTLHISSDYVFNGSKATPYVESDAADPLSAYGRSKLQGELAVAAAAGAGRGGYTIVRSSWLFGAHGKCFPKTILRLAAERDELNVVSDQLGGPTFTGHLARALVHLADRPRPGTLHVAGPQFCSWYEFAAEIVAASGLACTVKPISTDEYPLAAPRPAYSGLATERGAPQLPDWRSGLRAFMSELSEVQT